MARRLKRVARGALALFGALAVASAPTSSLGAQRGLLARLPIAEEIERLARPDAHDRLEAARSLALVGAPEVVVPALVHAVEGEAVPEVQARLVLALARRADERATPALEALWERASVPARDHILDGLVAIGSDASLTFAADRLGSPTHGARVCARLVGLGPAGSDRIAARLALPESQASSAACLARLLAERAFRDDAHRERVLGALLAAGAHLEPAARIAVFETLPDEPRLAPLAAASTLAADPREVSSALALLARVAPEQVPLERWRALLTDEPPRSISALVALAALEPELAVERVDVVAHAGGSSSAALLAALRLSRATRPELLALFTAHASTRDLALSALGRHDDAGAVLAGLPPAHDVLVALAIAAAHDPSAAQLLERRLAEEPTDEGASLLAIAARLDPGACRAGGETEERLRAAYCWARGGMEGGQRATLALETERDAAVVGWLAMVAPAAPSLEALDALLSAESTRASVLRLVPGALAQVSGPARRRLEAGLVRSTRAPSPAERAAALLALGEIAGVAHRAVVALGLEDAAPAVRLAAALALAHLPSDPVTAIRTVGRARIEQDPSVLAALRGAPVRSSPLPLHLRVASPAGGGPRPRVEISLADGRVLVLAPVDGEIVLFGVPDAEARVRLLDPERD